MEYDNWTWSTAAHVTRPYSPAKSRNVVIAMKRAFLLYRYTPIQQILRFKFRDPQFSSDMKWLTEEGNASDLHDWFTTKEGEALINNNDSKRTIFIGLATDGLNLYKSKYKDAWPLLSFFGNMHPDKRTYVNHLMHALMLCEKKPNSLDVLLIPYFMELLYYETRKLVVYNSKTKLREGYKILLGNL